MLVLQPEVLHRLREQAVAGAETLIASQGFQIHGADCGCHPDIVYPWRFYQDADLCCIFLRQQHRHTCTKDTRDADGQQRYTPPPSQVFEVIKDIERIAHWPSSGTLV